MSLESLINWRSRYLHLRTIVFDEEPHLRITGLIREFHIVTAGRCKPCSSETILHQRVLQKSTQRDRDDPHLVEKVSM